MMRVEVNPNLIPATADAPAERTEERLAVALAAARLGSWEFDIPTRVLTSSAQ